MIIAELCLFTDTREEETICLWIRYFASVSEWNKKDLSLPPEEKRPQVDFAQNLSVPGTEARVSVRIYAVKTEKPALAIIYYHEIPRTGPGGYVFGYGVNLPKDVVDTPAMEQAYIMGKEI